MRTCVELSLCYDHREVRHNTVLPTLDPRVLAQHQPNDGTMPRRSQVGWWGPEGPEEDSEQKADKVERVSVSERRKSHVTSHMHSFRREVRQVGVSAAGGEPARTRIHRRGL